jgi:phosphoribosylamine-glycine ligase
MAKTAAPKPGAPVEEHKKYADKFLAREDHKTPKSGKTTRSDEAKP